MRKWATVVVIVVFLEFSMAPMPPRRVGHFPSERECLEVARRSAYEVVGRGSTSQRVLVVRDEQKVEAVDIVFRCVPENAR